MAKKRARKKRIVPKELDKPASVAETPYVSDSVYVQLTKVEAEQPREPKKHWWQF
jgi:hypothetical protein